MKKGMEESYAEDLALTHRIRVRRVLLAANERDSGRAVSGPRLVTPASATRSLTCVPQKVHTANRFDASRGLMSAPFLQGIADGGLACAARDSGCPATISARFVSTEDAPAGAGGTDAAPAAKRSPLARGRRAAAPLVAKEPANGAGRRAGRRAIGEERGSQPFVSWPWLITAAGIAPRARAGLVWRGDGFWLGERTVSVRLVPWWTAAPASLCVWALSGSGCSFCSLDRPANCEVGRDCNDPHKGVELLLDGR